MLEERNVHVGGVLPVGAHDQQPGSEGEAQRELIDQLALAGEAQVAAARDLGVIVEESDPAEADQRGERDPDIGIAQIRPQQRGDHDRDDDQHPAHRGRTRLLLMRFRALFANILADLKLPQPADQPWAQPDAEKERGEAGEAGAERDVAEHAERADVALEGFVEQEVEHLRHHLSSISLSSARSM